MDSIPIISGDLLYIDADMIVQQCNCITKSALGLSQDIKTVLRVDPYGNRRLIKGKKNSSIPEDQDTPGTISIYSCDKPEKPISKLALDLHTNNTNNTNKPRYVACLFAQFAPGKPKFTNDSDSKSKRLIWFKSALNNLYDELLEIDNDNVFTIAFPYLIGCGLAGGNWSDYLKCITDFALSLKANKKNIRVIIIKKE